MACIQYAPMERRELRTSLNTHPRLVAFCQNIMQTYFATPGRIDAASIYVAQVDRLQFDYFPEGTSAKPSDTAQDGQTSAQPADQASLQLEAADAKCTNKFLFGCAALCASYLVYHNFDKLGDIVDALADDD